MSLVLLAFLKPFFFFSHAFVPSRFSRNPPNPPTIRPHSPGGIRSKYYSIGVGELSHEFWGVLLGDCSLTLLNLFRTGRIPQLFLGNLLYRAPTGKRPRHVPGICSTMDHWSTLFDTANVKNMSPPISPSPPFFLIRCSPYPLCLPPGLPFLTLT